MCEFLIFNTQKRYEKQKNSGNFSATFWQLLNTFIDNFLGFIGNLWLSLLTSSKNDEFPNNSNTHFQYRIPQALMLTGKWKVGLANVYLPGPPKPIPHVVTYHPPKDTTKLTAPLKDFRLCNLYKGTTIQTKLNFMPKHSRTLIPLKIKRLSVPWTSTIFPSPRQDWSSFKMSNDGWNKI